MSASKRAKRIRVNKEDLFRIAYCFTPLVNQAGELECIQLYVKNAEGGDIIPASQITKYTSSYKNVVRATMYITVDKRKVALDMENKTDARLEFKILCEEYDWDKLDELMDRLIDHLALPGTTVPLKHQCPCRNTCLADTLKILYPYLRLSSKSNLLKRLLYTRLFADPDIKKIICSICGTESDMELSEEYTVNMIGHQDVSQDVAGASAALIRLSEPIVCHSPNDRMDMSDKELELRICELLQCIKSAEQRTTLQDVEGLFRKYKMRMINITPAKSLSLLEWMSIILNFSGSCLDTIKSLEEIIESTQVLEDILRESTPEEIVKIYTRYADLLLEVNERKLSSGLLKKALEIANARNPELSVPVLFSLSLYYCRTGNRNMATSKVSLALSIVMEREPLNSDERRLKKSQRATATGIQGLIAFRECKYEKAKILLEEELSAYNKDDDDISVRVKYADCLLHLCDALLNLSMFETALDYCERSHDVWKGLLRGCGEGENLSHARIANCLARRGDHALMTGNIVKALKLHHDARAMRKKVLIEKDDWHPAVSASDRRVSCAYLALGIFDKAELHFGEKRKPVALHDPKFDNLSPPERMRKLCISSSLRQEELNNPIYLREILEEYNKAMRTVTERAYEQRAYHMHAASTLQQVGDVALLLAATGAKSEEDRQRLLDIAEEQYNLCLKIRKGSDGFCSPAIPAIAVTYDCLGKLFYYKGDLSKARQHFCSAQELKTGRRGVYFDCRRSHPDVAASFVYLGAIDLAENKVEEGETNLRNARGVYRKAFRGWKLVVETDFLSGHTMGEGSTIEASTEPDHPLVVKLNDIILKCREEKNLGAAHAGDGLNGYVKELIMLPYRPVLLV